MKRDHADRVRLLWAFGLLFFSALVIQSVVSGTLAYVFAEYGAIYIVDSIELETFLLIIAVISIPIDLLISVLFSKIVLRPVRELINGMDRLASGNFSSRVQIHSRFFRFPTFVKATESFNKMATELESTEMLRSDFINNYSHEVKTPIVSIAGFAKILQRGNLSPQEQKEYLDAIVEESMRLSDMATNVLHMTKVENQTILTNVSRFNLSEQIRSSILLLENKWSTKNLDFQLEFDEYEIDANEDLMKQVWINLLDNAIKFSEDNASITVFISVLSEKICISVGNQGPVISEENRKRIFGKFYQADESHAARGNGLGLSIVKRIVDLHNGDITVTSNKEKTVFTVVLPQFRN